MNSRDDSLQLLRSGKPLASEIFKKIGIHLTWHTGELPEGQMAFGICTVERAPESAAPDALAASHLSDSAAVKITMYRDRLYLFLNAHSTPAGVAAAYVLARELAHAMQGVARHSETGILKAHWSDSDFKDMVFHKLKFTPYDIELIYRGLITRMSGTLLKPDDALTADGSIRLDMVAGRPVVGNRLPERAGAYSHPRMSLKARAKRSATRPPFLVPIYGSSSRWESENPAFGFPLFHPALSSGGRDGEIGPALIQVPRLGDAVEGSAGEVLEIVRPPVKIPVIFGLPGSLC